MAVTWRCPRCGRTFTRANQRHACGVGDRRAVLRHRAPAVVGLYESLEAFVRTLGTVEMVARERYVLLRTVRIFADLSVMTDALRTAVHLDRAVNDPLFFKVVSDGRKVTHVAKLRNAEELERIKPFLREAYALSLRDRPAGGA